MSKRIIIIGHPLIAKENRMAFQGSDELEIHLIIPKYWRSESLGHDYFFENNSNDLFFHALPLLGQGRNSFFIWLGLKDLIHKINPDLIYCWAEPWCLSTWQVGFLSQKLNIPKFFYTAENKPKKLPWPFASIQKSNFKSYSHCIAPTEMIQNQIQKVGFKGKVFTIPLWIRIRKKIQVQSGNPTLIYIGRLIPLKRVHLIIQAIPYLANFKLRIIGDGPEKYRLIKLTEELKLQHCITFFGHIPNENLEDYLKDASLLILPTEENNKQAEQFGKAALEGVSLGIPVLASRTGNLLELSKIISTLFAYDLDSHLQVANAIKEILKQYPNEDELETSRNWVLDNFSDSSVHKKMISAFSSVLAI